MLMDITQALFSKYYAIDSRHGLSIFAINTDTGAHLLSNIIFGFAAFAHIFDSLRNVTTSLMPFRKRFICASEPLATLFWVVANLLFEYQTIFTAFGFVYFCFKRNTINIARHLDCPYYFLAFR